MTTKFSKITECANDTPLETSMDSEKLSLPTVISSKEVPIFRFHVNHVKFQRCRTLGEQIQHFRPHGHVAVAAKTLDYKH